MFLGFDEDQRSEVKILKYSGGGIFVLMLRISIFLSTALPYVSFYSTKIYVIGFRPADTLGVSNIQ